MVAVLKLHHRTGYRNAALLFNLKEVGGGVATTFAPFHRACQLNRAGE